MQDEFMIYRLHQLAEAMLHGAALGCQQVQGTYWKLLDVRSDGSCIYGFCAIGFANIGLLGFVPHSMEQEVARRRTHFMGREPLTEALGIDWTMPVVLPDGSQRTLLNALSTLNDHYGWEVSRIATWLLTYAQDSSMKSS